MERRATAWLCSSWRGFLQPSPPSLVAGCLTRIMRRSRETAGASPVTHAENRHSARPSVARMVERAVPVPSSPCVVPSTCLQADVG